MSKCLLGLSSSKDSVIAVVAEIPDDDGPIIVISDDTWKIQKGDRAAAYGVLHQQCSDFIQANTIQQVIIKASAVTGQGAAKLGMLQAAEVRGVVIASAGSQCTVRQMSKAVISRTYGNRKVDEYVADDDFWKKHTTGGNLRKMSREVTMLLVAARNN
jgi:hypothetical protein